MNDYDESRDTTWDSLSDPRSEVALLASCIWSKTARQAARHHITGSDFYNPHHEHIWDTMSAMDRAGRAVDPVLLQAVLSADDSLPAPARAAAIHLVTEVTTSTGLPDNAGEYASQVREKATLRRLNEAGQRLVQQSLSPTAKATPLASAAVRVVTQIRDHGAREDVTALTLGELMDVPDDQPEWVIPDLMERGDRLMLTGSEGAGKSALSRQLGIMAAAGLHPFNESIVPPIKAVYVDCENKAAQVRRQVRPMLDWLERHGTATTNPIDRVMMDFPGRIDITRDRDLAAIHRLLDACQPDLLVIGPMYRMSNRALQNDDDAAPFLVALDTLMERGVAIIIEAHAGHSTDGGPASGRKVPSRNLRPRGSSALLGWPEFGLGLRGMPHGIADLEPWRGHREARAWPVRLRRSAGNRWVETSPDDPGRGAADPPSGFDAVEPPPDPQGALV